MLAVALAFASSLSWGTADFIGGLQSRRRSLITVLFVAQLVALVLGGVYVLAAGDPFPEARPALLALGAGIGGCLALAAFYRGLAIGTMSIVAPVSATGAAVPGARRRRRRGAAGRDPGGRDRAGDGRDRARGARAGRRAPSRAVRASLGLALLAALGFGSFFVLIDAATEDGGAPWSLLLVRVGEALLLGAVALVRRPGDAHARCATPRRCC